MVSISSTGTISWQILGEPHHAQRPPECPWRLQPSASPRQAPCPARPRTAPRAASTAPPRSGGAERGLPAPPGSRLPALSPRCPSCPLPAARPVPALSRVPAGTHRSLPHSPCRGAAAAPRRRQGVFGERARRGGGAARAGGRRPGGRGLPADPIRARTGGPEPRAPRRGAAGGAGSGERGRGCAAPAAPSSPAAAARLAPGSGSRLPVPPGQPPGCGCLSQTRSFLNAPCAWHWGATVFVPFALLLPPPSFTRRWGYPTSLCVP